MITHDALVHFLITTVGMILSGHSAHNDQLTEYGAEAIGIFSYRRSGEFLSALFENWESEFLQMAAYVVLTAMLFQRGSAESRNPDNPNRLDDKTAPTARKRNLSCRGSTRIRLVRRWLCCSSSLSACIGGQASQRLTRTPCVTAARCNLLPIIFFGSAMV